MQSKSRLDGYEFRFTYVFCARRIDNWKTDQIEQFLKEKVVSKSST